MGYTIAAHAQTQELRDRMLKFMNSAYRDWRKVRPQAWEGSDNPDF